MFATLLTRPRLLTAAVFVGTSGFLAAHPTLAQSVGVDVWNVPELNQTIHEAADESARLNAENAAIFRRIALKEVIVEELIAGRATLADATAKFDELNAARPGARDMIRQTYPGRTDQEKTARNVISYALDRVPAAARDALARRLDAELQGLIAPSPAR